MADINVLKTYPGGTPYNGPYGEAPPKKKTLFRLYVYKRPGGGALGYFLGRYVPPGTPNWHPVLKKNSPKIDTPFKKWAYFLYPVLEFALKLIPRSRKMGQFFILRSRKFVN